MRVAVFVDGKMYRINEEVEVKEGNKKYWGGKIIKKIAEEGIRNIEEGNVVVVVVVVYSFTIHEAVLKKSWV